MRIGIDARMFGQKQTGIGIYIENLIKNILKLDNKNEYVLFLKNPSNEITEYFKNYKNIKIALADGSWYSWKEQLVFPFQIAKEKIDLMHFPHFNVPIFCPVKFVVTIHDMTPKYFPGNKVGKSFFRRKMFDLVMKHALKKSEQIIAVSKFTKNEISRFYPQISKEKIEVIYEGIREEFFHEVSARPGYDFSEPQFAIPAKATVAGSVKNLLSEQSQAFSPAPASSKSYPGRAEASISDKPFIFYTGVWRNHKNLVGLIKAFKILKDKYGIPQVLVLGGSEDPSYPEVRRTWEGLGLRDDIVLTGFLRTKDQISLYRNCDLYVSPSFSEGFGFTPIEAMSQGAVVALSDIPAHREISGDLPIFFDPNNVEDIAEKIHLALSDDDFRRNIKNLGPEYAQKYQWQNCAQKTLNIYKDCA